MAKDPAFLFYPGDWMTGTMVLSRHLKGCYIDLLIAQFNNGPLSLESIKAVLGIDQASWTVLSKKFQQDSSGNYYNERLATEIEKRKVFTESRKKNGINGGRPPNKPYAKPYANHMGNLAENEITNEIKDSFLEKSEKPFLKNPELWSEIKQDFFNSEGWQYRICTEKTIERQVLIKKMREFITDLDLKGEYKDLQELKSHFINWFNKQTKSNGSSSKQQQQASARATAIEIGKREFDDLVRKSNTGS